MDQDLIKLFERAGFTEKEASVYLALLELSRANVAQISRYTGLKRPIIYVLLESLIKRGYANEIPEKKISTFQATDPSAILAGLKRITSDFSEMLPFLQTLHNKGTERPKITYFEGKEGILRAWEKISYAKEQFFVSNYIRIQKMFPGLVERWISDREKKLLPPTGRHLVPDTSEEIELDKRFANFSQGVRISKTLKDMNMDFTIFDNTLAITSFESNPFIVIIESRDLVQSMKLVFEMAWAQAKPLE